MIVTELQPLTDVEPPLPNRVIRVSREEPIVALADGEVVLVTWIGERTAVCVRGTGRAAMSHYENFRLVNKARILIDPARLVWVSENGGVRHYQRGRRFGSGRPKVHRCVGCGRTAGKTRFKTPKDDYCVECEEAGKA